MLWHDGRLIEADHITLDASDRGLLLGDGLFETLPVLNRTPFRLADHVARLRAGAETLGLSLDRKRIASAVEALAKAAPGDRFALRVTVTRGPGRRGLAPPEVASPTILATTAPWPEEMVGQPLALAVTTIRRNEHSPISRLKTLAYLDNVLGLQEARRLGADDALFLNTRGQVACTGAGNLFALLGGTLLTPPVADGVRPGVTRALVLSLAGRMGLRAREASLTLQDLLAADGALVTNSLRLVCAVTAIDGRPFREPAGPRHAGLLGALRDVMDRECGTIEAARGTGPV